ncbi:MAG: hypothetical protein K0R67_3002, partial [Paenibacillus sp.]|nr:hypothetical protein [Paenibacillus sp.]
MNTKDIVERLISHGVTLDSGLSQLEISKIQNIFNFSFPQDLRELLLYVLPISKGFVNWRDSSEENVSSIRQRLNGPLEGILFDIEHNSFWYDDWGDKPDDLNEAKDICKSEYLKFPQLIPIYSHRY